MSTGWLYIYVNRFTLHMSSSSILKEGLVPIFFIQKHMSTCWLGMEMMSMIAGIVRGHESLTGPYWY